VGQTVTVRRDHGHRLGLEHQQCAVQRVAALLVGYGEDCLRDHVLERGHGELERACGGKLWDLREVGARHADHLGVGTACANLHPVVVHQLDGDVALGQQLDVVVEFARGNGAGTGLLDLGRATGAHALVEVGCGNRQRIVRRLEEKVREDGNGRLALDDRLSGRQFAQQLGAGDSDLKVSSRRGCRRHLGLLSCCGGCILNFFGQGGLSGHSIVAMDAGQTVHRIRRGVNCPASVFLILLIGRP